MIRKTFLFILTMIGVFPGWAQQSPEELGEKIFGLFKNESYDFREVVPTANQIMDKAQNLSVEVVQNRIDDFNIEYPIRVKKFNEKCETILEKGAIAGIVWPEIELNSIKPYKKSVTIKKLDQTVTIEIIKLCIYFSFNQRAFSIIIDTVVEYNFHYLVSDDAIEFAEITNSYKPE